MSSTLSCMNNVKRTNGSRPNVPIYMDAVFIGDRSGSMQSMGDAPQKGVRDFLEKHKELYEKNGGEIHVTIVTFDDETIVSYSDDISKLTEDDIKRCEVDMMPRNLTKLYDTVIDAIESQKNRKSGNPEQKMVLSLFTDGEDNVSKNTSKMMSDAITEHRQSGVICQFLAANQDAILTGSRYGFSKDNSIQVTSDPIYGASAFQACTASTLRSATTGEVGFTPLERIASANDSDRNQVFTGIQGLPRTQAVNLLEEL